MKINQPSRLVFCFSIIISTILFFAFAVDVSAQRIPGERIVPKKQLELTSSVEE